MKRLILILISSFFCYFLIIADSPRGFNYQALAKDKNGFLIVNKDISLKISVVNPLSTESVKYSEIHRVRTGNQGNFSLIIGTGSNNSGSFELIDWSVGSYLLRIEIDIDGGNNFQFLGESQLMSVPFSLFADKSQKANTASNAVKSDFAENANRSSFSGKSDWSTRASYADSAGVLKNMPDLNLSLEKTLSKDQEIFFTRISDFYVSSASGDVIKPALTNTPAACTNKIDISGYKNLLLEADKMTYGTTWAEAARGIVFYAADSVTKIKPISDNGKVATNYTLQDTVFKSKYQGLIKIPTGARFMQISIEFGNPVYNFRIFAGKPVLKPIYTDQKNFKDIQKIVRFPISVNTFRSNSFSGNEVEVKDQEMIETDWGVLLLPRSYSPSGAPVRLVIYCHGGGATVTSTGSQVEDMVEMKYLLNNGYAVMDVGGMPYSYAVRNKIDWYRVAGNPMALLSYQKAYDFVTTNYNIKRDGVLLGGASNGGLTAFNIATHTSIPIKCIATMSGLISMENAWNIITHALSGGLYSQYQNRANIIQLYGMTPVNNQAELTAAIYDPAKVKGFDPLNTNIYKDENGSIAKYFNIPVKLWQPVNDEKVLISYSREFVKRINNGGGYAILREMASGGHAPETAGTPIKTFVYEQKQYQVYPAVEELLIWFNRFK